VGKVLDSREKAFILRASGGRKVFNPFGEDRCLKRNRNGKLPGGVSSGGLAINRSAPPIGPP
jgi:hypothetical protein